MLFLPYTFPYTPGVVEAQLIPHEVTPTTSQFCPFAHIKGPPESPWKTIWKIIGQLSEVILALDSGGHVVYEV